MRSCLLALLALFLTLPAFAEEQDDKIALELTAIVRDPRNQLAERIAAAKTLAKLGPKASAAVPHLIAQVNRLKGMELEGLQEAVFDALGQIGSPSRAALPALAAASGRSVDLDQALKRTTKDILAAPDNQDLDLLVKQLRSRDVSIRLRAAKAIGELERAGATATNALLKALADVDGDVRRAALVALRRIDPDIKLGEEVAKSLMLDLKDPNAEVRLFAVRSLGRLGSAGASASSALEALLTDPDRDVRKAAVEALQKVLVP